MSFYRYYSDSDEGQGKRHINQKQLKRPLPSLPTYLGECFITIIFASFVNTGTYTVNTKTINSSALATTSYLRYTIFKSSLEGCASLELPSHMKSRETIPSRLHMPKWAETCIIILTLGGIPTHDFKVMRQMTSLIVWSVCRVCAKCDYVVYSQ